MKAVLGALVLAAIAASPAPQAAPAHELELAQEGYPQAAPYDQQQGYQPAPSDQSQGAPPPYDQPQGGPGAYDPSQSAPPPSYGQPDEQQGDQSQGAYQQGGDQAGDGSSGDYGVDSVGHPRKKKMVGDEPEQQAIPPFTGHTQEELDEYYAKYGPQLEQFEDRYGPQPACAMPAEPGKAAPDMSSVPCLNYGQERQSRERMKAAMLGQAQSEMNRCTQDCTVRAHYCKDTTRPAGALIGVAPDCRGPYEVCTAACRQDYDDRTRLFR